MKPKEIQEILEFIAQSGLEEVNIETVDIKITVKKSITSFVQPSVHPSTEAPQPVISNQKPQELVQQKTEVKPTETAAEANYKVIKSPMIGTFYRSPGPTEEAFVNVGDTINVGTTVCIIEAMKLFNEIESEFSGKIVKILVQESTPVEYDQPLFLVDPS